MKKKLLPVIAVFFLFFAGNTSQCRKNFLVVSYNVENLFDTINNPHKSDDEFTPEGKKHWNTKRYNKKLNDLANVLMSINKKHPPDLIALIEVENRKVVEDLLKTQSFSDKNYSIVHEETTDPRGIDVALLYNPETFKYLSHRQIKIYNNEGKPYHTREILLVKGLAYGKDTLYVFINHWKSRAGGREKTEYKRVIAAKTLREQVDKILSYNPNANIICLGDFNDTPFDKSLSVALDASTDSIFASEKELFNLSASAAKKGLGTITYYDNWYMIDNIIVTQNMLRKKNDVYVKKSAFVYRSPLNLYYNPKANDSIPNKTYGGRSYYGGVSDHLPVGVYLKIR